MITHKNNTLDRVGHLELFAWAEHGAGHGHKDAYTIGHGPAYGAAHETGHGAWCVAGHRAWNVAGHGVGHVG